MITTRYINECENADKVNFVRKGRILFSGTSQEIKTIHEVDNIGEAFDKMYCCEFILQDKGHSEPDTK